MKPIVDHDLCTGCGNCELECPEVFRLDDEDGLAYPLFEEMDDEYYDCARAAQDSCPVEAISIES